MTTDARSSSVRHSPHLHVSSVCAPIRTTFHFPTTGAKYQISETTGVHPTWSPDGKELFYFAGVGQFVAVSVTTRPAFTFGNPVPVTSIAFDQGAGFERNNDITLDGKRFIGVVPAGQNAAAAPTTPQIQVVLNWFEELKARVPTK